MISDYTETYLKRDETKLNWCRNGEGGFMSKEEKGDYSGTKLKSSMDYSPDVSGWTANNSPMDGGWGVNTSVCIGIVAAWFHYWEQIEKICNILLRNESRGQNYGFKEQAEIKKAEVRKLEQKVSNLERESHNQDQQYSQLRRAA